MADKKLHIVMFPWLAFGHILPYLELAKLIAQKGHLISFVSTPRNIDRLPKLPPNLASHLQLIKLPLPKLHNLPDNAEATTDVPYNLVPFLKKAYDALEQPLARFLESSTPDWIFYDFAPYWAGPLASNLGIKTVFFSIFSAPAMGFLGSPSELMGLRYFEIMRLSDNLSDDNDSGVSDTYRYGATIQNCDIVADWLDQQRKGTVVYVAFGSETKPSQEDVREIALGLEKSGFPFFWVLRIQRGPYDENVLQLPDGFEDRIRGRGVVCTSWVPQLKILGHESVGGFLTHSGGSSVVEAIQNEKPLVLLTFLADQGMNARVLEEKKMGYSVPRDERDGSFTSESVAESLRLVMVEEEGRIYREKIKEVKDLFVNRERQDRYVNDLLAYLRDYKSTKLGDGDC
ncbi:UDP-glycosyltransferase 91A1-like [Senna tora]|uniref:UDP-glycosyltransferase 91A1-like n=1 Tax=Senna tora TaxID=362788 RepID=A0A834WR78_9FABA|nr:UDP-glycosyltransferase 91A1-like [Senna tora]